MITVCIQCLDDHFRTHSNTKWKCPECHVSLGEASIDTVFSRYMKLVSDICVCWVFVYFFFFFRPDKQKNAVLDIIWSVKGSGNKLENESKSRIEFNGKEQSPAHVAGLLI